MVSQTPPLPPLFCSIPLVPAKAGTQIGTVGWIPNISAFTRVSTRYARE